MQTIYAVCPNCAHVEPRPSWVEEDWQRCEVCGAFCPEMHDDPDVAEDRSQEIIDSGLSR